MLKLWRRFSARVPRAVEFAVDPAHRYLVLAPHPDDETLGAGGLLAKAATAGCAVSVLVLTDGARLMPKKGDANSSLAQLVESRKAQCRSALSSLGIDAVQFLNAEDGRLSASQAAIAERIGEEMATLAPTHILTPHANDRHRDHRACIEIVRLALKISGRRANSPQIFGYEVWLPCQATHCLDISDVIAAKRNALECYRETYRQVDLLQMIMGLNRYRAGSELTRSGWCEAFEKIDIS